MDIYAVAFKRLLADERSPMELHREMGIPSRTLYDIKSGKAEFEELRVRTARLIAVHYFPKQLAA